MFAEDFLIPESEQIKEGKNGSKCTDNKTVNAIQIPNSPNDNSSVIVCSITIPPPKQGSHSKLSRHARGTLVSQDGSENKTLVK